MRQLNRGVLIASLGSTLLVVAVLIVLGAMSAGGISVDGVVYLSGFLVMALAGCLIVGWRPTHAIGWTFVAGGAGTLLASLLSGIAAVLPDAAAGWTSLVSLELYGVGWVAVTTLPLLLFPDGRPRGRWALGGVWASAVLAAVVALAIAVGAQPDDAAPPSPLAIAAWSPAATRALDAALLASTVLTIGAAVLLALRWRRSEGVERRRLAWLGAGGLAMATLMILSWVAMTIAPDLPDVVGASFEAAQIALIPLAMLGAILDARLFDIDVVFRRSLVYSVLLALVVGVYGAAIAAASLVAAQTAPVVGSLIASVVVAFALSPVRDRLADQVERRLYGSRRRPAEALALVGGTLTAPEATAATDAAATLAAAAAAVGSGLRLGSVRIVVDGEPPIEVEWRADRGAVAAAQEIELAAFGSVEGRMSVATTDGDRLSQDDIALLHQLAPQIALVARAAAAAAAVQRSREEIVNAREAERFRLRRDLHDGLGPALVGLALEAEATHALIDDDPARAAELSRHVALGLRGVIDDVRGVVDGLRPADVDQLGLAGALAERARALGAGGIEVSVVCDDLDLSPAAEVAVYRIATEALSNVARHSGAHTGVVSVTRDHDAAVVVIEDDGRGFSPEAAAAGVGLGSMRARAEEIGGTLTVSSGAGGTQVRAALPLGEASPQRSPNDAAAAPSVAGVAS